jgi:hypothetical protein
MSPSFADHLWLADKILRGIYSIASFMIRCLFGSDGSVIPSNCTIRAILNIVEIRLCTSIGRVRFHVRGVVDFNHGDGDVCTTCTKSILKKQFSSKIQQLHGRVIILHSDISSSQSRQTRPWEVPAGDGFEFLVDFVVCALFDASLESVDCLAQFGRNLL